MPDTFVSASEQVGPDGTVDFMPQPRAQLERSSSYNPAAGQALIYTDTTYDEGADEPQVFSATTLRCVHDGLYYVWLYVEGQIIGSGSGVPPRVEIALWLTPGLSGVAYQAFRMTTSAAGPITVGVLYPFTAILAVPVPLWKSTTAAPDQDRSLHSGLTWSNASGVRVDLMLLGFCRLST